MRGYVGVTDGDWYRFLAARPELREVNFWRPGGGRRFHSLAVGEPFFFKTHFPHNRAVGGGFYSDFVVLRLSEAWDLFGAANGAANLEQMRNPTFGDPRLIPQRLGQRSFQAVVLTAYHRRCAITGTKIAPVLQAAHNRPVSEGGQHRLDNGLLLRSDVHTLFDKGYLGVDPRYRLQVSPDSEPTSATATSTTQELAI